MWKVINKEVSLKGGGGWLNIHFISSISCFSVGALSINDSVKISKHFSITSFFVLGYVHLSSLLLHS